MTRPGKLFQQLPRSNNYAFQFRARRFGISRPSGLQAFSNAANNDRKNVLYDEIDAVVADFLTNLRHLCEYEKIDFNLAVQRSQMHFEEERLEG